MALLTTQQIQVTGTEPSLVAAAAGGDTITPDERVTLWVENDDASSHTATITTPAKLDRFGQELPDITVTVPAGERRLAGPLNRRLADTDGLVHVAYDDVTSVTVAAVRL